MPTQESDFESLSKRLDELEDKLASLVDKVSQLTSSDSTAIISKKQKPISAKEFLLSKKTKKDVQNTLLLCYFLERYSGFLSFNVSDLEDVFRQAKEQLPKNLNDMINKNISKGFLMEAVESKNNKKAWVLTSSGEKTVEEGAK